MSDQTRKLIQSALNFDPIGEAEKMLGEEMNQGNFGVGLSFIHDKRNMVERLMEQTGDVHWNCSYDKYCSIVKDMGFEQVYEEHFQGSDKQETQRFYWHRDGFLLTVESFTWSDDQSTVNRANLYYNLRVEKIKRDDFWRNCVSSGSVVYEDANIYIWAGDHDVRDGLKHVMSMIREYSVPMSKWHKSPYVWLLNYTESRSTENRSWEEKDAFYKETETKKIAQLPAELRDMLLAAQRR